MKKILSLNNIRRDFRRGSDIVHVLKGLSFDIMPGEFITIMGSSGSGKTTLLNLLGCLDKPTGGTYHLDGLNVGELSRDDLARLRNRKIGFVFQSYNLLPRTSALDNVALPLFYDHSVNAADRRRRAVAALEAVKLSERMHHMPNELSGGQQQRVAIARALVNEPVMILADEATGNLDTRTSYEIMTLIQELNGQGRTIVFVTHETDIAAFSSRTIVLKDGLVVKDNYNENQLRAEALLAELPPENDY